MVGSEAAFLHSSQTNLNLMGALNKGYVSVNGHIPIQSYALVNSTSFQCTAAVVDTPLMAVILEVRVGLPPSNRRESCWSGKALSLGEEVPKPYNSLNLAPALVGVFAEAVASRVDKVMRNNINILNKVGLMKYNLGGAVVHQTSRICFPHFLLALSRPG